MQSETYTFVDFREWYENKMLSNNPFIYNKFNALLDSGTEFLIVKKNKITRKKQIVGKFTAVRHLINRILGTIENYSIDIIVDKAHDIQELESFFGIYLSGFDISPCNGQDETEYSGCVIKNFQFYKFPDTLLKQGIIYDYMIYIKKSFISANFDTKYVDNDKKIEYNGLPPKQKLDLKIGDTVKTVKRDKTDVVVTGKISRITRISNKDPTMIFVINLPDENNVLRDYYYLYHELSKISDPIDKLDSNATITTNIDTTNIDTINIDTTNIDTTNIDTTNIKPTNIKPTDETVVNPNDIDLDVDGGKPKKTRRKKNKKRRSSKRHKK
jgi:hypothetical protein